MRNTLYDQARKEGIKEGIKEGKTEGINIGENKKETEIKNEIKTLIQKGKLPKDTLDHSFLKNVKIIHKIGLIIAKLLSLKFFLNKQNI